MGNGLLHQPGATGGSGGVSAGSRGPPARNAARRGERERAAGEDGMKNEERKTKNEKVIEGRFCDPHLFVPRSDFFVSVRLGKLYASCRADSEVFRTFA